MWPFTKKKQQTEEHNYSLKDFSPVMTQEEYASQRSESNRYWECKYNLYSADDIAKIPISATSIKPYGKDYGVTGQIEYYLHMKGGYWENNGKYDLAIACYKKSNDMMPHSAYEYQRSNYICLPNLLRKLGRLDEAAEEEAKIETMFPNGSKVMGGMDKLNNDVRQKQLDLIDELSDVYGNDLVIASWVGSCCPTCAMYRCRVYSRYGKNKKYPLLPNIPTDCGISLSNFFDNAKLYTYRDGKQVAVDPIKYSNRPFIDDRTDAEKEAYERRLSKKR